MYKQLIKYGADPKLTNSRGQTPLHVAAISGNVDALMFFMRLEDIEMIYDKEGRSPIQLAAFWGNNMILSELKLVLVIHPMIFFHPF